MIINVRGTHGSGKSMVVRRYLKLFWEDRVDILHVPDRARPFGYHCRRSDGKMTAILGSYESTCGGCDTIPQIETVYSEVKKQVALGHDVLFEGILAQHSAGRLLELQPLGLIVVVLTTPLETCIEAVRQRRLKRGDDRPFDPKNVIKEHRSVESSTRRLTASGVVIRHFGRDEAFSFVAENLGGQDEHSERTAGQVDPHAPVEPVG